MMSQTLVSIIIPAYNAQKTIEETVQSALEQTHTNLEVIIVDDGSSDDTFSLCEQIKDSRLKCFTITNSGASAARNFGLDKATGDYIQFLDADDLLLPNKLEIQLAALKESAADLSYGQWTYLTKNTKAETILFKNKPYDAIKTGKDILRSMGRDNWFVPVFCWLTKRSSIEKAGRWNESISTNDDGEFFTRVLYNTDHVIYTPELLGHYRREDTDSLSKPNTKAKVQSALQSYDLIHNYLSKDNDSSLLTYPKRLYYIQFLLMNNQFPELAKIAGKRFDAISLELNIRPNLLKRMVAIFGLRRGYQFFRKIRPLILLFKK